jgi:heme-degrading monooxygenase HmoA
MFVAVYSFKVKEEAYNHFLNSWEALTRLIYQYEGSLGSRLHRADHQLYIGYAQWPDRETWSASGNKLPEEAQHWRQMMRDSCEEISTVYTMEVAADLLQNAPFEQ